jgi:hypothetical protein
LIPGGAPAGSPGHDAALPLPGFNDAFLGLGPDVGAQETGAAPLSFGPAAYSAAYAVYCTAGTSSNGCRALLAATGRPSATASAGFQLTASGVEGGKDGLFFYGASGRQGNAWGNGTSYQCVVPPVRRGGLIAGVGAAGTCTGAFAQDLNARWCPTCSHPSHNPGVGAVVQAQLWYRDPQSTSNRSTSFSDAVEVCVQP